MKRVCACVVGPGITPVPSFLSIPLSFLSPQSLCRRGDAPPPLLLGPPICHSAHWWSLGGSLCVCVCVVRMLLSARITQASELQLNTQVRYTLLTVFCCCFFKNTHSWGLLWRSFISTCVCVAVFQPFDVNLASLWLQRDLWSCSRCLLLALFLRARVCVTSLPAADVIVSFPDHACCHVAAAQWHSHPDSCFLHIKQHRVAVCFDDGVSEVILLVMRFGDGDSS